MTLVATFDAANSRVQLVGSNLPDAPGLELYLERDPAIGSWLPVRNGTPLNLTTNGGDIDLGGFGIDDYEFTPNVQNDYRIRTDFVYDLFNRTVVNSWANATSGQAWSFTGGGSAANWDTDATQNAGIYTMADATGSNNGQAMLTAICRDFDIRCTLQLSQVPTGNSLIAQIRGRAASNNLVLRVAWDTGGNIDLTYFETGLNIASVDNHLSGLAANTDVHVRHQAIGQRYRCKVWTGLVEDEPDNWAIDVLGTVNPVAGYFQVEGQRLSGNTNVNPLLRFYNYHAADLAESGTQYSFVGGDGNAIVDTFERTVVNDWGSTDTGDAWVLYTGGTTTAADYQVPGLGYGTQDVSAGVAFATVPAPSADVDIYVDVRNSTGTPATAFNVQVLARHLDLNNTYLAQASFDTGGNIDFAVSRRVGGVLTTLVTLSNFITGVTAADWYTIRFRVKGSTLQAKIWETTDPEPAEWAIVTTDTNLTAAASVGLRSQNGDVTSVAFFDNFIVNDISALAVESVTPAQDTTWLKFPLQAFLNREVDLCNWTPENRRARGASFDVLGRFAPVAVTEVRALRAFDLLVRAADSTEAEAIELALQTGTVLFLQTPGPTETCTLNRRSYPASGYFQVGDITSLRVMDGRPTQMLTLPLVEVAPPAPEAEGSSITWGGLYGEYATWADVIAAFPTWLDVLQSFGEPQFEVVE